DSAVADRSLPLRHECAPSSSEERQIIFRKPARRPGNRLGELTPRLLPHELIAEYMHPFTTLACQDADVRLSDSGTPHVTVVRGDVDREALLPERINHRPQVPLARPVRDLGVEPTRAGHGAMRHL